MSIDVSIIIPVHNRQGLVVEAIDSALKASLRHHVQVIVVDDGSTDGTWDVLKSFGSKIVPVRLKTNVGQSAARNAGMEMAEGQYLKFLDSDDVLCRGHLDDELSAAATSGADVVVSGWATQSASGSRQTNSSPVFDDIIEDVLAGVAVPTSAGLYRRGKTAWWDPELRKLDDWDFFVQTALGVQSIVTVPGEAYALRDHPGPRVTAVPMLQNAREHHVILRKIESRLAAAGQLTDSRKRRIAQYFYKELRVLSLYDRQGFEAAIVHIRELDERFQPEDEERHWWMRLAARCIGTRRAVLMHTTLKRVCMALLMRVNARRAVSASETGRDQ